MTTSLPDVNFWLALVAEGHLHHKAARDWFATQSEEHIAFCRVTQMGFLRLLTNASAMGDAARTIPQAWEIYSALRSDRRVVFLPETEGTEIQWRELTMQSGIGPSSWTDAYLAAFAQARSPMLATFDTAFSRWASLNVTILQPSTDAD